jgi:hypothetical protein
MVRSLLSLALCCAFVAALPAEEWYLITELELQSIEHYREISEANKQTWRLQVQGLKSRAENLQRTSESLNRQLVAERETVKNLMLSYEGLEQERLTELALRDGEIVELKQAVAIYKRQVALGLVISISFGAAIIGYISFLVVRFLRL